MVLLFFQFKPPWRKKSVKWTTFDTFLRKDNFILNLASLLSAESHFPAM